MEYSSHEEMVYLKLRETSAPPIGHKHNVSISVAQPVSFHDAFLKVAALHRLLLLLF